MNTSPETQMSSPKDYIESALGIPFTTNNSIRILKNGDEIFPAMLEAIENAKQSILFETYVYWTGNIAEKFAKALAEKAKQGLSVRVLLDAHGSSKMDHSLIDLISNAGGKVCMFRPLGWRFWDFDKRTHRKILVCDQKIGFTGGVGIAKEWEGDARNVNEWRETHFKFEGDAVKGLSGAFWNNWIDIDGEFMPGQILGETTVGHGKTLALVARSSPSTHQSDMELVFETLLATAEKKVTLTTPYFNIGSKTTEVLKRKSENGIPIEILLPGDTIDKGFELLVADESIEPLLKEKNITIRRYQRSMIHSKIIRIDDTIACVGSPNFNQRSRKKDFEIAVIIIDKEFCAILDQHYQEDIKLSVEVDHSKIRKPSLWRNLKRKATMLFREQL